VALFTLALGWCGIFGVPGCSHQFSCVGDFVGTCSDLDSSTCTTVHGCRTIKATCMTGCEAAGASCPERCDSAGGGCASPCDAIIDQSTCESVAAMSGLALHQCVWDSDANTCGSPCGTFKTSKTCGQESGAGCVWIECTGTPKDSCDSYPGDNCPTVLGCDRTSRPVSSTE
jgi:hypothetical protein